MVNIKFSLKKSCYSGETCRQSVVIYLHECYSVEDVLEAIKHESLHAAINWATNNKTTAKQDHFILRSVGFD